MLVVACVLSIAGRVEAQPRPTALATQAARRNSVQADLGLAVVGLAYERVLTPRIAVQVETHLFSTWFGPAFGFASFLGVGGQLRPSLFLLGDAPAGLYLAPFVRAEWVTAQARGVTGAGLGWSSGLFLGYSFVFWNRLNLRLGAGGQYMSYAVRAGDEVLAFRSLFFALDAIVGVLF